MGSGSGSELGSLEAVLTGSRSRLRSRSSSPTFETEIPSYAQLSSKMCELAQRDVRLQNLMHHTAPPRETGTAAEETADDRFEEVVLRGRYGAGGEASSGTTGSIRPTTLLPDGRRVELSETGIQPQERASRRTRPVRDGHIVRPKMEL